MEEKTKDRFLHLSRGCDEAGVQDSFCFRALFLARRLAEELVDEKGQLRKNIEWGFPVYEAGYSDDAIRAHVNKFLNRWMSDPSFVQKFRRYGLPVFHPYAEEVIRWTLDLAPHTKLQDFHVKRAVIAAALCPLRQTIGSCFATAPAIDIQQFHTDLLIDDLYELLSRGRLKRVVDGVEYTAPFCPSTGMGDLKKALNPQRPFYKSPGFIRAFEVVGKNAEESCKKFYRRGMTAQQLLTAAAGEDVLPYFKGAVDNALLKIWEFTLASYCDIKMEFSKWNLGWCVGLHPQEAGGIGEVLQRVVQEKLEKAHERTQTAYQDAVVALEQLRSAERQGDRTKSAKAQRLQMCEDLYKQAQEEEKSVAGMLQFLFDQYKTLFQLHFQEVYDPEFSDHQDPYYDDRRAGFRLVYKHGRTESALWTAVQNKEQFIAVLDDFFRVVETSLSHLCQETCEKDVVSEVTTQILQHLQMPEFFKSSLARAKKWDRLPWAYSSGGLVEQIASIYFRKSAPLKFEERVIQDELDLFTFIIETMKALPLIVEKEKGLLFQSPTHVCLLLPGMKTFSDAWNDRGFTYTWIRDEWLAPAKEFYAEQKLSRDEQLELYRRLGIQGALNSSMTLEEFAHQVKHIPADVVGSFLFQTLPFVPAEKCKALLQIDDLSLPPLVSSDELFRLMYQSSGGSADEIRQTMRELKLASPVFLFADTNWPNGYFSFVIHPITHKLEVWKTDRAGVQGAPLPLVKTWFGKESWRIFSN